MVREEDRREALTQATSLLSRGFRFIEITLTVPDAFDVIEELRTRLPGDVCLGAGTVLDQADARRALEAGADFVVSPVVSADIAEFMSATSTPFLLGACSPSEVWQAMQLGASAVKLFPARLHGPEGVRALSQVFGPHVAIIPTGSIHRRDVATYLLAGALAVGISGRRLLQPT